MEKCSMYCENYVYGEASTADGNRKHLAIGRSDIFHDRNSGVNSLQKDVIE